MEINEKIGVVGLGYVGLPLALELAKTFPGTLGFDISAEKVETIKKGIDPTQEGLDDALKSTSLKVTANSDDLKNVTAFIVAVPTPVDENHRPNLTPLERACETVGKVIKKGALVVFESTVYPGVTEEICGPKIAAVSGLKQGKDFKLGYSPERINPGDKKHGLRSVIKIVSGEDEESLSRVAGIYEGVVDAGVHRAQSIKVAEAAKVIENTQRDLNIALMNELAIIFDRMGISTKDVLDAAGTKWNFVKFSPGLVGGHCIGVDPYYLTTKAEQLGYHPQVILAGRRINDGMGVFIAQRLVKNMLNAGLQAKGARVGVLGLTFKENVSDVRNSRVPSILSELKQFGVSTMIHDPLASPKEAKEEYGIELSSLDEFKSLDGLILAVSHREYLEIPSEELFSSLKRGGVFVDVKSVIERKNIPEGYVYWSL